MKNLKKENKSKKTVSEPDLLVYDLNEFAYDGASDKITEEEKVEVDYDAEDVEVDF